MSTTKYIVVSDENQFEKMIIFHASIGHDLMAKIMKRARYPNLVSAGFIDEFMQCYGESVSTFTQSRKNIDTIMLHTMLEINDKKIEFKD